MMKIKKPINIIYEISVSTILVLIVYYGKFVTSSLGWAELHIFIFILPITSITLRTLLTNSEERLFVSTFSFGYLFGIYLWSLFVIAESFSSSGFADIKKILGILFASLVFGIFGSTVSFFLKIFLKKMIDSIVNSKRE